MRNAMPSPAGQSLSAAALSQRSFGDLLRIALIAVAAAGLRLLHTARAWRRRAQGRRTLAMMSAREWRDIGITRSDAWVEAEKRFWQP